MKYIELKHGQLAKVDNEDFEYLKQWKWYCDSRGYARRYATKNGKAIYIGMHRVINKTPVNMITDHINHDRLDNRRSNLRSCTRAQNMQNCRSWSNSGCKGVYWYKRLNKWQAQITHNNKHRHLGYFLSKEEAKKAYLEEANKLFGEFVNA